MRILRRIVLTLLILIAAALFGVWSYTQISHRRALARQAAEIAAHREAQRAAMPTAPAGAPAVPSPAGTPRIPLDASGSAALPDSPAPATIAWTTSWTDFRGARRDGHYTASIRTDLASVAPLWRQPIGGGYASFVVAEGRAFTIEQRGADEVATAYDVLTGRELWTHAWKATFIETLGGPGPRATPVVRDGTVYALGATGELRALDAASGTMRWRANILDDADASNLNWGMAASPLISGNTVVTVPGGGNGRSIVAYDRATGRIAWSALDDEAAYSSPVRATVAGIDQIVVFLAKRVVAISPEGGTLLWQFSLPNQGTNNAAQPVIIGDNLVFVSSAGGGVLIEVTNQGSGLAAREVWQTNRMKNDFSSSVLFEGHLYGLDAGILACLDAATGALKWKAGRYGNGQTLLADGHLIITSEDGDVAIVRATPDGHQEISRLPAVEGRTWNHPAIADGFLLVRNATQMTAFDLRPR